MNIAICDDIPSARAELMNYINKYSLSTANEFTVTEYSSGEELGKSFINDRSIDLVFLDIYMEGINGMEAAKRLRTAGFGGEIVFTTTSTEFALDGYTIAAAGYLVKPYTYQQFSVAMNTVCSRLSNALKSIEIIVDRISRKIPYRDIMYIESDGRYGVIRTEKEHIKSHLTLKELESILCSEPYFMRCHRCNIVNLNHIAAPTAEYILMKNGERVMINIKENLKIRQQIADYFFSLTKGN
ncbi:MAG: LytR/AlgR family response regulator transcription factor [Ruminiclostridium sp.]